MRQPMKGKSKQCWLEIVSDADELESDRGLKATIWFPNLWLSRRSLSLVVVVYLNLERISNSVAKSPLSRIIKWL